MTPDGYHDDVAFAAAVGALSDTQRATRRVLARSVQGREVTAITVRPAEQSGLRPQVVVVAGMHGVEVISTELALRLLEQATDPDPPERARSVLAGSDVTIVPSLNPDGRAAALASLSARRPFNAAPRRNADGVDLNRNWPWPPGAEDHWSPLSGTRSTRTPWSRGPHPLSEPETAGFAQLLEELRPVAMLNLHSTGQLLTYPWACRPEPPADQPAFDAMATAFRSAQPHVRYRSTQSRAWYPIVGSSNDYVYDRYGTLAMTVETSPSAYEPRRDPRLARWAFWFANPREVEPHLDNDAPGCWAALDVALGLRR